MLAKQKWQIDTIKVLEMVFEERLRQVEQYGHNEDLTDYPDEENHWLARTSHALPSLSAADIEEMFRQEYEAYRAEHGQPTWMHLVREEFAEAMDEDPLTPAFITEMVQVAALAVSWVECKLREQAALADLL